MAEPENHTLAPLRRMDAKIDALAARLERVEATMTTKAQLGSVLHVLKLKLDLLGTERRDDHAAIARRLDALESRVAALEAREPA
jgi:BMFP domain-containing protein YqiC